MKTLPESLQAKLGPALRAIADGAAARDIAREVPYESVANLIRLGAGALRIPVALGGGGLSVRELMKVVIAIGWADSNVAQALRGHFAYVEGTLKQPPSPARDAWLHRFVAGEMVGSAASEPNGPKVGDIATTVTAVDGRWLLNGTKFYSTGTLFADWIHVSASHDDKRVMLLADASAEGVTKIDDWNGFGQRLTGSGTTKFRDVEVDPTTMEAFGSDGPDHLQAFYQLYHLATLAGILGRAVDDIVAYVRGRKRSFLQGNTALPADDPQVLQVIGEVSSSIFAAEALALASADAVDAFLALGPDIPREVRIDALDKAEIATYRAQVELGRIGQAVPSKIFEVGGASALERNAALDRHWRNVRTLLSHNPTIYKARMVGEFEVHDRGPQQIWALLSNTTNS